MTARRKGLALAAIHLLLVASLGGKYLLDRVTRPRVWARAVPVDPYTPFRGRYIALSLEVQSDLDVPRGEERPAVELYASDGQLRAKASAQETHTHLRSGIVGADTVAVLSESVVLFIPAEGEDPSASRRQNLWVEVTVPRRGLPRPIQLGEMRDGAVVPLESL